MAVVPGSAFGSEGEGFLRMSFAAAWEDIQEAMNRIKEFIKLLN